MTALAEIELTLGDDAVIVTQIHILVSTQGDCTPLDPSSFREEDRIELCMGLGQEHLDGVLWILNTETFLAFSSGPK